MRVRRTFRLRRAVCCDAGLGAQQGLTANHLKRCSKSRLRAELQYHRLQRQLPGNRRVLLSVQKEACLYQILI